MTDLSLSLSLHPLVSNDGVKISQPPSPSTHLVPCLPKIPKPQFLPPGQSLYTRKPSTFPPLMASSSSFSISNPSPLSPKFAPHTSLISEDLAPTPRLPNSLWLLDGEPLDRSGHQRPLLLRRWQPRRLRHCMVVGNCHRRGHQPCPPCPPYPRKPPRYPLRHLLSHPRALHLRHLWHPHPNPVKKSPLFGFSLVIGTSILEFACFAAFWAMQLAIVWKGMEGIHFLEKSLAPILIILTSSLLIWAYANAGRFSFMLSLSSTLSSSEFWSLFFPFVMANINFWVTTALNISDFTQYTKLQQD